MFRTDIVEKPGTSINTTIIEVICPMCGKTHSAVVQKDEYEHGKLLYAGGALLQNAFPSFSPDVREMFITGICPSCWDSL